MDVNVDIEYCGSCGYKRHFLQLTKEIKNNVSNAIVNGRAGRRASFEVRVNDELVYSKLETLTFPDTVATVNMIKDVSAGEPVRKINKHHLECVLL
ncbi:PREDICTED: migration and invasion enhancer 1 [Dinoponera quadriceps]|uniref:Migration and invasion enhancer 1 n=1 Tax=Dinoponera quadriceps TaxID=609295 RepID=A0A6P3YGD9_DINQU|nr:PREDICTED: migration and invasion enhancer 1 [Dinoponera quadriceps]XP_014488957.1 PREDICTED: migration and invasion enhancer 1 [Dinoponera quadriceps]XP_014488958.1 PREDICTED: migration and invasion enhancer 1 [Dinoponera quadriceps]XP_014488959.1 PREDICTED: migration and invasion enhancer 1 [Dinoponera quadriceps]